MKRILSSIWLTAFRIGAVRKSSPFDLIIYPSLTTLVRSRWRDSSLAFFLRFDWPWLRLGPTLCAWGFSCAVPGFGQVKREKHALLISVMAGYWPSFFFRVFMDRDTLGTRGLFLRATTSFVGRRPRTRAAKPREKTSGIQGISVCENAKNNLTNIQPSRLSWTYAFRASHFLRLDRNRKPRVKSLWSRVGRRRSQGQSKRKKSEANIQPSRLVNNACFNFVSHF